MAAPLPVQTPAGVEPAFDLAAYYPILIYAGAASLLKRWDDHALALLFPFFQLATLAALFGWLRRRGVSWPVPLAAAALLSQLEPLYSGFLTGMAEVPLSCLFLLFGTAYSDCLDETDTGARRRLADAASSGASGPPRRRASRWRSRQRRRQGRTRRRRSRWRRAPCPR